MAANPFKNTKRPDIAREAQWNANYYYHELMKETDRRHDYDKRKIKVPYQVLADIKAYGTMHKEWPHIAKTMRKQKYF
jgi:hypothetical protein